jgi:hypothetical protein
MPMDIIPQPRDTHARAGPRAESRIAALPSGTLCAMHTYRHPFLRSTPMRQSELGLDAMRTAGRARRSHSQRFEPPIHPGNNALGRLFHACVASCSARRKAWRVSRASCRWSVAFSSWCARRRAPGPSSPSHGGGRSRPPVRASSRSRRAHRPVPWSSRGSSTWRACGCRQSAEAQTAKKSTRASD